MASQEPHNIDHPAKGGGSSLEARIRSYYNKLPESERRIADLILRFPGEVAAYSATEIAALSGGSKAGVTRLVRRLGFDNFDAARRAAREAQSWGSPLYLLSRELPSDAFNARIQNHIEQDARNISLTLEALNRDAFGEIVKAIKESGRIFMLGFRNSEHLAGYVHRQIIQVRDGVLLLSSSSGNIAEEIQGITSDDLLFVVGFRRRIKALPAAMAAAHEQGARVLYVTDWDAEHSPHATWTIPCAVRGRDLFDRYAGAMSLLHFLCVEVVNEMAASGRARLRQIERLHEELDDFD